MDRRLFLRAGALAGAATAVPIHVSAMDALFAPHRGAGTQADPLRLNANENPLGIGPSARAAAIEAFSVANRYTDAQAALFRERLARHLGVSPSEIFLGNGSTEVLQMVVQALGGDGARIITADPTFEDVAGYRRPLGTELVTVPLDARYAHDLEGMRAEASRSPGLSIVYLCNPNNPTGTITPSRDIEAWIDEADDDVFFVVDEAYFELVDEPAYHSCIERARSRPNVLVVRTFSKIYGMAGMRLGYGVAHEQTVPRLTAWISNNNTNQIVMAAASASLDDEGHRRRTLDSNRAARALVTDTLDELELPYLPSHTNFLMHYIGVDVQEYIERFAERGIAVGRPFPPMLDYNRLSLGTPEEMESWADTLRDFRQRGWV
jgi:histidinol-phosphate aminotransferase